MMRVRVHERYYQSHIVGLGIVFYFIIITIFVYFRLTYATKQQILL